MQCSVDNIFAISAEGYWSRLFPDPDYHEQLYLEGLGFPAYELLEERREADGTLHRRIKVTPKTKLPGFLQKLLGGTTSYEEHGRFDPERQTFAFQVHMGRLSERATIRGELRTEPEGPDRCRRVCAMEISVRVPGVGRKIERIIEANLRENYAKAAAFTNAWIRARDARS